MASSRDAQDILDLKHQSGGTARPKKKGPKPKLIRPAHIPKEVWLLETQGDRAPPVALTAIQPKKPKFTRRVKPWEWQPFTHPNRKDGLVLRHWRKKPIAAETQPNGPATPAEGVAANAADGKTGTTEPQVDNLWAKYNVKIDVPTYTEEQYEKHLKSDDWSKEETDYLMELVGNFDLRWIVIADRYDYGPAAPATPGHDDLAVIQPVKPRTMEDLKARYYKVASSMMAVNQPLSSMTQAEFSLHEKMTKFDPSKEARRKRMAEQLLERTDAEIEEEKLLLAELKRITQDEDDFIAERQELYERLAAPPSRTSIAKYETSAGLIELGQSLQIQDRYRGKQHLMQQQRRQIASVDDNSKSNSPSASATAGLQRGASDMRRSIDGSSSRKDSKGGQYVPKQLSARDETKYGVQRPEKLLTGEKIRHLRIERRVTARASSVAAKVQDTMVELGIPIKPVMATEKITAGYEQLCSSLDLLLDARRVNEKIENEIKVLAAQKEAREGGGQDAGGDGTTDQPQDDDTKDETADAEAKAKREAEEEADAQDAREAKAAEEDEDANNGEYEEQEQEQEQEQDEDDDDEEEEEEARAASEDDENEVAEDNSEDEDAGGDEENDNDGTPAPDVEDNADKGEDEDEEESRPSTRHSRKRSLSVLSSAPSQKGTKRQRK